jgi:hypothetical protein
LRTLRDAKQASSILDSVTDDSSQDFEDSVAAEQSDKQGYTESQSYKYDEHADAGWGWGSASVSGQQQGSSSSAREDFTKNMLNATHKHSARRSAKRDVQVDTSYEVKQETTGETSIEREVANINLSRTLNFVLQQLNQEFVTILHLTDVRVAYFNPDLNFPYREATLAELDSLLTQVLVPGARQSAKEWILFSLSHVRDGADTDQPVVETSPDMKDTAGQPLPGTGYLRFKAGLTSKVVHPVTNDTFEVEGLAVGFDLYVLRTEGLLVDSVLGAGDALDQYARDLQGLEVRRREADLKYRQAEDERLRLGNRLAREKDDAGAAILAKVSCPCGAPIIGWPCGRADPASGTSPEGGPA